MYMCVCVRCVCVYVCTHASKAWCFIKVANYFLRHGYLLHVCAGPVWKPLSWVLLGKVITRSEN